MENSLELLNCSLEIPSVKYKESYLSGLRELQAEGREVGKDIIGIEKNFQNYVDNLNSRSVGLNLPEGWVPQTEYWIVNNGKFVGCLSIRHYLTEQLLKVGGHIGYTVVPSERKKGYVSQALKIALLKAKSLGISKVLITCDSTNIGSRKVIETNRGILENEVEQGEGKPTKLRFWVDNN